MYVACVFAVASIATFAYKKRVESHIADIEKQKDSMAQVWESTCRGLGEKHATNELSAICDRTEAQLKRDVRTEAILAVYHEYVEWLILAINATEPWVFFVYPVLYVYWGYLAIMHIWWAYAYMVGIYSGKTRLELGFSDEGTVVYTFGFGSMTTFVLSESEQCQRIANFAMIAYCCIALVFFQKQTCMYLIRRCMGTRTTPGTPIQTAISTSLRSTFKDSTPGHGDSETELPSRTTKKTSEECMKLLLGRSYGEDGRRYYEDEGHTRNGDDDDDDDDDDDGVIMFSQKSTLALDHPLRNRHISGSGNDVSSIFD